MANKTSPHEETLEETGKPPTDPPEHPQDPSPPIVLMDERGRNDP